MWIGRARLRGGGRSPMWGGHTRLREACTSAGWGARTPARWRARTSTGWVRMVFSFIWVFRTSLPNQVRHTVNSRFVIMSDLELSFLMGV
jgi:hypothetical protein